MTDLGRQAELKIAGKQKLPHPGIAVEGELAVDGWISQPHAT